MKQACNIQDVDFEFLEIVHCCEIFTVAIEAAQSEVPAEKNCIKYLKQVLMAL